MSQEARNRWSQKRCPFGVGYSNGMCCTSECGAWREWDTRGSVARTEEVWKNHRPGWFSDWKVKDSKRQGTNGDHWVVTDESEGKGHYETTKEYTMYLWTRTTYSDNGGSSGATCGLMHPG